MEPREVPDWRKTAGDTVETPKAEPVKKEKKDK